MAKRPAPRVATLTSASRLARVSSWPRFASIWPHPRCERMSVGGWFPKFELGQTEKHSVRAYVFRFALELGHCSMQSACLKCAAGSTGRRNTGVKSFGWGFECQGLTWPFV
jgi:hypothetical protein